MHPFSIRAKLEESKSIATVKLLYLRFGKEMVPPKHDPCRS